MQKQPGANTIDVTALLDRELDALQEELPPGITIDRMIFRQADFIQVAVNNVIAALRDGGFLVIAVVLIFLANTRAAAITLTAMPLSLAAAILVLRGFDVTINTMTLGGLAIAIGALVDDAIIDVENVMRRLRENAVLPPEERRAAAVVVCDATVEIRTSIVFATVIIVLVFLPIFGLSGVEGRLLTPLAYAYIVALLASLGVALVVTPALCFAFLPSAATVVRGHEGWLARTLKARFAGGLPYALDRPVVVTAVSLALLVTAGLAMTRFGTAFLPEFQEGSLTITVNTLPGTSLVKSDEIGRRVEQILLAQPEVVATARRTGRAELDEHVQGVEAAEIDVGLREGERPREELLAELRQNFAGLPGTNVAIGQPISHRIDHMLSGTRANIAVKIVGEDLVTLRRIGERVRDAMGRRRRGRGSDTRTADGDSLRSLRAESGGDRSLRTTGPGRRRGDRDELRRHDGRTDLRSRDRVRPGRQVRCRRCRRFRTDCRPAGGYAVGPCGADSRAGGRASGNGPEHDSS